jgi:hypothetical protein
LEYRIKPEPKPDVVRYMNVYYSNGYATPAEAERAGDKSAKGMVAVTFDGETGDLKSVERVK